MFFLSQSARDVTASLRHNSAGSVWYVVSPFSVSIDGENRYRSPLLLSLYPDTPLNKTLWNLEKGTDGLLYTDITNQF